MNIDWSKGFSSRYYISVVNRKTWRDEDRIEITGGTIKRTYQNLRDSADINCVDYSPQNEQLIRVWLDARQEGAASHTPLFTGLATSPDRNIDGRLETNALQCYSILKIAEDVLLPRGWYAPADISAITVIKNLLDIVGAPIRIPEGVDVPTLKYAIIAEQGENNLSMVDKILEAMGDWHMKITGFGEIIIEPYNNEAVTIFDSMNNDVIEQSLTISYDWYACPNVFRAILDDSSAVARDDNPNSPLSTVNRGREIWVEEDSCYLNENETLADYARRRLEALQQVNTNISYTRRFDPDVVVDDVISLHYPEQGLIGDYIITEQRIELGYGAKTSEEVIKI